MSVVYATPSSLLAFTAASGDMGAQLTGPVGDLADALGRYFARCDTSFFAGPAVFPSAGGPGRVLGLQADYHLLDVFVNTVAQAFVDADSASPPNFPHGIDEAALDRLVAPARTAMLACPALSSDPLPNDPALWALLTAGTPTGDAGNGIWVNGPRGGGFYVGPDGALYPIVIPSIDAFGVLMNGDIGGRVVRDGGGLDPGWQTVAVNQSVEPIDSMSATELFAYLTLGGLDTGTDAWRPPAELGGLVTDGLGVPVGVLPVSGVPPDLDIPLSGPPSQPPGTRAGSGDGVVEGVGHLTAGFDAALEADQGNYAVIRREFQVAPDGRRRVLVNGYQLVDDPADPHGVVVVPMSMYRDEQGQWAGEPTMYHDVPTPGPAFESGQVADGSVEFRIDPGALPEQAPR